MKKIIIDCDPGHDDVIASLVALANDDKLQILGFTTVAGNNTLEKVTKNILKVQDYLGLHIPVSLGYDRPIKREPEPQPLGHGESGMDGPVLPDPTSTPSGFTAVEFIRDALINNDSVTLVCLAPLTNIAHFIEQYPELSGKIEEIVIMGGSVYSGNIQVKSEFNIYHDPDAAKIVFNSKIPLTMAGLEVCEAGGFDLELINDFKGKGRVSQLVYDLLYWYAGWSIRHAVSYTTIFDMTAMIYLINPDIYSYKMLNVDIELDGEYTRGMTVCEEISDFSIIHNPVKVLLDVDRKEHTNIFINAINLLDERCG